MKKDLTQQIKDLKASATSKEDLMSQLASLETGEISPETLQKVNGGVSIKPQLPGTVLGLIIPPTFPEL